MSNSTDLERMKNIIRFYILQEFGEKEYPFDYLPEGAKYEDYFDEAFDKDTFKDLSNVSLAYTEDSYYGVYPMQVYANLIEPSIVYTIAEEPIHVETYKSLKEMADHYDIAEALDFCELISVCDNYFELNREYYPAPSFVEVNA